MKNKKEIEKMNPFKYIIVSIAAISFVGFFVFAIWYIWDDKEVLGNAAITSIMIFGFCSVVALVYSCHIEKEKE